MAGPAIKLHARSHTHGVAGDGTALTPESVEITGGPFALRGDLSPAQLTADQNNYDPAGLADAVVLRLSTDASRTITGLAGGADGRLLLVVNVGAFDLVLADESASSTAANRFALDAALTLGADTGATLLYDATTSRWRLVAVGKAAGGGGTPTSITNGGGTVAVNASGGVTITPAAGQHALVTAQTLRLPDGDPSTPALAFSAETGLGFYRAAGNRLCVAGNGNDFIHFFAVTPYLLIKSNTAQLAMGFSVDAILARTGVGSFAIQGLGNGQALGLKVLTELTTIAAAATTDTTIQIPQHAIVIAVSVRVTVAIPTAATFDVGVAAAATRYGAGLSTALNTTHPGTNTPMQFYAAAAAVRITPNLTPGTNTGRVRVTIHYLDVTPPTS